MHESEPCDEEHRQHFEEKTCREVLTLQIGIEKHDEVDDHRRPREEEREEERPTADPYLVARGVCRDGAADEAHEDEKYRREHDERRGLVADARGIRVVIIIVRVRHRIRECVINVVEHERDKSDDTRIERGHRTKPEHKILRRYLWFIHRL